jgi:hypothetical protein
MISSCLYITKRMAIFSFENMSILVTFSYWGVLYKLTVRGLLPQLLSY